MTSLRRVARNGCAYRGVPGPGSMMTTERAIAALQVEWSDESSGWLAQSSSPERQASQRAYPIYGNRTFEFDFIAPHPRLEKLSVCIGTFGPQNESAVWCELIDESKTILARSFLEPRSIVDNSWPTVFDLQQLDFSVGATYRVRLSCPFAGPENCVAIWTYPVHQDEPVFIRQIRRSRADTPTGEITSAESVVPSRALPGLQLEWSDESCVWLAQAHAHARQERMQAHHIHGSQSFEFDFVALRPQL